MTVIDKILNEWSFRCHDGIVDIRNPKKLSVLKEILVEYKILTEDIDDDILNALSRLDPNDPRKEKVLTYLAGGDDEKDKEIEKLKQQVGGSKEKKQATIQKLKSKNIPEKVSRFIVFEANEEEQLEDLNQLIDSLNKLEKEGSLKEKVGNLAWINDIVSGQSSLGTGKGEILLALMLKGGKLADEAYGDVQLGDENIEVKQSSKSGKETYFGAIISDLGRSNDYKTLWNNKVLNGQSFREKYGFEKLLSTWTPIFLKYKDVLNKKEYVEDLKKVMETGDFSNVNEITENDFKGYVSNFYKKIAYCSVGDYLSNKSLILMNNNLDYIYLNEDEYKDAILNDPKIYANNAFSPRISYKEKSEDEQEKATKPTAAEKVQQKVKEKEKGIETEIEKDPKAQELKQAVEKIEQELKDKKSKEPNRQFKFLEDKLKKAKDEYQKYVNTRKAELSKVREEFTNSILKAFTAE